MADNFSLKPVILLFVLIILGVVFIRIIGDNQVATTELSSTTNESITMTSDIGIITNKTITSFSGGVGQLNHTSIRNITFFGNWTNNTYYNGVEVGGEVNFTRSGRIIVGQGDVFAGPGPYNVSYTFDENVTGVTANKDVVSIQFFGDANISTHHTSIVHINTEVNFTKSTGVIVAAPANFTNKNYNISYTYEGDLYVSNTTSHPLLKLLTIFFVLVLIAFGIQAIRESSDNFNFGFGK